MNETNFRLERIKSGKSEVFGGLDELQVHALYDMEEGILKDRYARLEVLYRGGENPELVSTRLDMEPILPTPKTTIHFENNVPTRVHTFVPHPYPTQPKDMNGYAYPDQLREDSNYRAMINLIPDGEQIKPVLETLVK